MNTYHKVLEKGKYEFVSTLYSWEQREKDTSPRDDHEHWRTLDWWEVSVDSDIPPFIYCTITCKQWWEDNEDVENDDLQFPILPPICFV